MAKKLQISIPEPCHENWDAMTPVDKGRFCNSCQKQVVDFSTMSDRQVAEFFKKPSTGSVCGRFMSDQLERDIEIPKKRIPWFKYFFQVALPAFLVSIKASAQTIKGEAKPKIVTTDTTKKEGVFADTRFSLGQPLRSNLEKPVTDNAITMPEVVVIAQIPFKQTPAPANIFDILSKVSCCPIIVPVKYQTTLDLARTRDLSIPAPVNLSNGLTGKIGGLNVAIIDTNKRTINGVVTDEIGAPVPGATVVIKGTRVGTPTDNNGNFRILTKTGDVLLATASGHESAEITVGTRNTVSLTMRQLYISGTEVILTAGSISVSYNRPKKIKPKKETVVAIKGEIITGKVMDERTNPLPNVSVIIKGTKTGTVTKENGEFNINATAKDVLEFTTVGFERKEVKVKDQKEITVYLQPYTLGGISFTKSKKKKEPKNVPVIPEIKCTNEVAFKIFPNPVEAGGSLTIAWEKADQGYYTMQLLNPSGQSVHQQEVWIAADSKLLNIDIPKVAAGNYFIVMTDKKTGKKFTEKIIIQ
ncbi:MAG: T9SS type A sorting domain-containing protein [Chitinophagaceae bacterium]|nr:T9SS type A sorting domain-containing protein [Chitinophagaceae bacterium]